MKTLAAAAALVAVALAPLRAGAAAAYLCCPIPENATAPALCVAQAAPCVQTSPYAFDLAELPEDAGGGFFGPPNASYGRPNVLDASFPEGVDGLAWWSAAAPWAGVCLVAPNALDPLHAAAVEPVGCLSVSLFQGVGAELAHVTFPVDPRWDAYTLCYGAPTAPGGCQNPNDLEDTTIALTPGGSCCGPANVLRASAQSANGEWGVTIGQAIPDALPPYVEGAACVRPECSSPVVSAAPVCVPTTCAAQRATCETVPDGCGSTLFCGGCSAQACTVSAPGMPCASLEALGGIVVLGMLLVWQTRRSRK